MKYSKQITTISAVPTRVLPQFYSFRRCPYAMRARMALIASRCVVELREISLKNKPASMLKYSPKGTVPVLITSGNNVIDESIDIMHWALHQQDPLEWLSGLSKTQHQQCDQLLKTNDHEFKANLDRYKYPNRYLSATANPLIKNEDLTQYSLRARSDAATFLQELDQRLTRQSYLLGDSASLADIAIFPFIRQFAHVDKAWFDSAPYPALQRWLNEWLASSLFHKVMVKYPPWQEGDAPTYFGGAEN